MPRLAIVSCVRNEAGFLPAFLLYHHAIGVERVYLFLDRCTDESAEIAARLPWVRPILVDPVEAELIVHISDLHVACMNHALRLARTEGFDWLLILDPDEFAYADNRIEASSASIIDRADLRSMLDRIRPETATVRLATHELVPMPLSDADPFWMQRFFQTEPRLAWDIYDPLADRVLPWSDFLGHRQGKWLVRTSCEVQAYDSHRWVPEQGRRIPDRPQYVPLPAEDLGWHWHFFVSSQRQWREKFRKQAFQPAHWMCGSEVELPKRCWRQAASCAAERDVRDYFARWIARPEAELRAWAEQGVLAETTGVESVLREAGWLRGDELVLPAAPPVARRPECFSPSGDRGPGLPRDAHGRVLEYPAALIPADGLRGQHALECSEGELFLWLTPSAAIRLEIQPGRYRLRLHMRHLAHLWTGVWELSMNGRAIPPRDRRVGHGTVSQVLVPGDFGSGTEHWLEMRFSPVDTTSSSEQRALGAPFFGLSLDPLSHRATGLWAQLGFAR